MINGLRYLVAGSPDRDKNGEAVYYKSDLRRARVVWFFVGTILGYNPGGVSDFLLGALKNSAEVVAGLAGSFMSG